MAECLRDLLDKHKSSDSDQLIATFCTVTPDSVARWRRHGGLPKGDEAIHVRVFLDMVGYKVVEFASLGQPLQQLNKMIAFRIVMITDVQKHLKYANLQSLYRTLRGGGVNTNRQYLISRFVESSEETVEQARELWLKRWNELKQGSSPLVDEPPTLEHERSVATKQASDGNTASTAQVVAHLFQAIDTAVSGTSDVSGLASQVGARTSHKRLRAVRSFLEQILSPKRD